jgi:ribosome-binding protein aMBF1 (putative translation factor)
MTDLLKSIGTNLNRVRLEKGLSRQNLSAQLGISERDLEEIEEGTKDFDVNLCPGLIKILNIDLNDLVSSESNRNKLLHLIKSKLDTLSEQKLLCIFEYIDLILKK